MTKNSVGIFEAKTHFVKIIAQVIAGEEILITKRGKAVAKIVPIKHSPDTKSIRAAIFRLRNLAKTMKLGKFDWEELKQSKNEGRS